jgi:hypothetical protein
VKKFQAENQGAGEGRQIEKLDDAARPGEQAEQAGQQRYEEDGSQEHRVTI